MSKYKRVLLKLSGEALAGDKGTGFDEATCVPVAKQIKDLVDAGTEVASVGRSGSGYCFDCALYYQICCCGDGAGVHST